MNGALQTPLARAIARKKRRAKERGIALIMVMGAVAVLTVMLAEFQDDTSAELASAMSDRDSVQAEYMARSAVNLSRLLIATEPTIRQAIAPLFMMMKRTPPQLPVWEFSDRLLGAFNDSEASKDFAGTLGVDLALGKNLGMPGGRFELVIVDEDSKIDANLGASNDIAHIRLGKELIGLMAPIGLNPLFEQKDKVTGAFHDRLQICSALVDWADTDDNAFSCDFTQQNAPSGSAKEDAYYQLLPKAYFRKNAPFDSLEELHMVTGVGDDFWATLVDPEPENPKKRIMTVWGQGAVNVNTANAQTILGVVCSDSRAGVMPAAAGSSGSPSMTPPPPTATTPTQSATPAAGVGTNLPAICTDPTQMGLFITGFTMAKGISMGAPIFGTPQDFIATMKGQGMLGPMLTMLGMQPVQFRSESEFAKAISTESKMFSVYAVGVVKGYKRETRLSIHAVVDFRTAPQPGQSGVAGALGPNGQPLPPGSPPPAQGQVPGAGQVAAGGTGTTDPNSIAAAMQPSTGGTIVFWHVE